VYIAESLFFSAGFFALVSCNMMLAALWLGAVARETGVGAAVLGRLRPGILIGGRLFILCGAILGIIGIVLYAHAQLLEPPDLELMQQATSMRYASDSCFMLVVAVLQPGLVLRGLQVLLRSTAAGGSRSSDAAATSISPPIKPPAVGVPTALRLLRAAAVLLWVCFGLVLRVGFTFAQTARPSTTEAQQYGGSSWVVNACLPERVRGADTCDVPLADVSALVVCRAAALTQAMTSRRSCWVSCCWFCRRSPPSSRRRARRCSSTRQAAAIRSSRGIPLRSSESQYDGCARLSVSRRAYSAFQLAGVRRA
jgi:hypothetical protein